MSSLAARTTAYAAFAWSVLFLVPHVYWAAGGTAGLPDGESLEGLVATINYAAIALSVAAAALALSLLPQRPPAPRRLLLAGAWSACVLLGVRGAGGLLQGLIAALGGSDDGSETFVTAFEGLFLLGGILFGLAAAQYGRASAAAHDRPGKRQPDVWPRG